MNTIKLTDKGNTKIIAHRGVSGLEPENTAAAFLAAGNRTHYGVETDIWRTADGNYICNHDGRTGRIADIDLVVEETDFAALRALKLRDKDGVTDRADLVLPTPYEYFKICKKYEKLAVAELKSNFTLPEIREITDIAKSLDYLGDACFIAFEIANLDLVKELYPEQRCQFLTCDWDDALPDMLAARGMGLDIHFASLTEERIAACHAKGVEVNCWTVDDPADAARLIGWGVDQITSNILE
ncbi:MAG: hypothetical protein E7638_06120 [Ruminococcaceae bacterium]|nr:hypothetical protein [Oscillospiraceae bacterium]